MMKLLLLRRLVPRPFLDRWAERRMNDFYRTKIHEARTAKDAEAVKQLEDERNYELWDLEQGQRLRAQQRLFRSARRLYVLVPELTEENSVDGVIMDDAVLFDLASRVRKARKERQELWLAWVPLVKARGPRRRSEVLRRSIS